MAEDHGKPEKTYTIYLNTRPKTVHDKDQTYESIVELFIGAPPAPDAKYTVTFEKNENAAPQELVAGGKKVVIIDGKSRFYVEETGQS